MKRIMLTTLTAGILMVSGFGMADAANEEFTYGRNLMTEQERIEHREQIRTMATEEERAMYRKKIHEEMKQRATERGIAIPAESGQPGKGQGTQGSGYGAGQGMGGGRAGRKPGG